MFCRYQGCTRNIKAACRTCQGSKLLCRKHYWTHIEEEKHQVITLEEDDIRKLLNHNHNLNSNILICISQITKDTNQMISALKNAAKTAIDFLKSVNSHLDDISQFTEVLFDKNRVSFILNQIGLICTEMPISPRDQVKRLSDESKFHSKNSELFSNSTDNVKMQIPQKDSFKKDLNCDLTTKSKSLIVPSSNETPKIKTARDQPILQIKNGISE